MEYYGYAGNVLYVDLTTGHVRKEPLDISSVQKFIGGTGVGLRLLLDQLKPKQDPLSPENVLVLGTGPLIGTLTPGSGRCYLATKYAMPASKDKKKYFISVSTAGSHRFGNMMKNAGYDHVVITGRAEKPSYLKITDESIEICDAGDIWGKDIYETSEILRERHRGKTGNCGTYVIGRAGENLVRFSLGYIDNWHTLGRFAGAVVGSKNLKAVVTLGEKGIKIANGKQFMEVVKKKRKEIINHPDYESAAPMVTDELLNETRIGSRGCTGWGGCACKSIHEVKDGKYKGEWFASHYPIVAIYFTYELQLKDFAEGFKLMKLLDSYGLCMLTTVRMMVFISQLYENGVLSKKDMGGIEFAKGEIGYYIELIEKIINKQDIGAIMAEGWIPLCERLGIDASTDPQTGCAISKGVDFLVDARTWPSPLEPGTGFSPAMGLASVVNAKTKHNHSATYWANNEVSFADVKKDVERMGVTKDELSKVFAKDFFETGRLTKYAEETETVCNALGMCSTAFHSLVKLMDPTRDMLWLSEVYSAVTGFDITPRELLRAGERILNLEKLINVREGFTREDDKIPPVYLQNIEVPVMAAEGERYLMDWFGRPLTREDLEGILDSYYEEKGWDIQKGVPKKEKLIELGLSELNDIVESM